MSVIFSSDFNCALIILGIYQFCVMASASGNVYSSHNSHIPYNNYYYEIFNADNASTTGEISGDVTATRTWNPIYIYPSMEVTQTTATPPEIQYGTIADQISRQVFYQPTTAGKRKKSLGFDSLGVLSRGRPIVENLLDNLNNVIDYLDRSVDDTSTQDITTKFFTEFFDDNDGVNDNQNDVVEGRKKKYKIKKKYKKFLLPLLLAYKLKFFALVPVMMGGLILLAGSTGLAGFFFALFAAVMGLKSKH